jgi:CubicO group peptidase (beta-lactamase class C family)
MVFITRRGFVASGALKLVLFSLAIFLSRPSLAGDQAPLTSGAESQFEFGFEHYDAYGYSMHVVHRGDSVSTLPRAERPLDVHYEWAGNHTLDELLARTNTTGFIVLKDGKIVYERYFMAANENLRFLSASVAKSFTSTLVGLAIAGGKIASVRRPVTEYLPELKGSGFDGASIQDLLEMSSGVNFTEDPENPKSDGNVIWRSTIAGDDRLTDYTKSMKSIENPGSSFAYQSVNSQVLGWLVTRVTGQSLADYMSWKIWRPLGMEQDALWATDSDEMEAAFCGLNATLRDYARFGLLFANKGKWNGRQIVPEEWVAEATIPHGLQVQSGRLYRGGALGYAYQWWTVPGVDHAFSALGLRQQFIYVNPAHDVVIVKTGAYKHDDTTNETLVAFEAICSALESP